MQQIAAHGHRQFYFDRAMPGEVIENPFSGELFPVLVWAVLPSSHEDRQRLASAFVASGCRYFVCGGADSAAWEHAADRAFIELNLPDPEYEEQFVMTTSHRGQAEEQVAFFFVHNTNFEEHDFSRYLVLMFGEDESVEKRLIAAVQAEVARYEWLEGDE